MGIFANLRFEIFDGIGDPFPTLILEGTPDTTPPLPCSKETTS